MLRTVASASLALQVTIVQRPALSQSPARTARIVLHPHQQLEAVLQAPTVRSSQRARSPVRQHSISQRLRQTSMSCALTALTVVEVLHVPPSAALATLARA